MKKIAFLTILIFISGLMISCNEDSSRDSATGYIDPGNWTGMTTVNKSYTLAGFANCTTPDPTCLAVVYQGTVVEGTLVGIAVKNGANNLKIYWQESAIRNGSFTCSVHLNNNAVITDTITITGFIDNGDGTCSFTFSITGISGPITAIKV